MPLLCDEEAVTEPKYEYLGQSIQEWTKQNLWKTAFKKFERTFKIFEGCLPQILLGPLLKTLSHSLVFTTPMTQKSRILTTKSKKLHTMEIKSDSATIIGCIAL